MVSSRYQKELGRQITRFGIFTVLICFSGFVLTLSIYTIFYNFYQAFRFSRTVEGLFRETLQGYEAYLSSREQQLTMIDCIRGGISENHMSYLFHDSNRDAPVRADLLLRDPRGEIAFTTFSDRELTYHLRYFDEIVQQDHAAKGQWSVYRTVYYFGGAFSRYLLVESLYDERGDYAGGASLYLDGQDWNGILHSLSYSSIITDAGGQVIASSNRGLVDGVNRFHAPSRLRIHSGGQSHWVHARTLPETGVMVYALASSAPIGGYFLTACVTIAGILLLAMAAFRRFAARIANINSASLAALHREIGIIAEGRTGHRITLHSDDEFEAIARHINDMLDSIELLSGRNYELLRQQGIMEVKQLEAQFHPHFLYNTLECIRASIHLDPGAADAILLKLTSLLRYSISDGQRQVMAEEDFAMLEDYLEILKYRFGERFTYHMEVEPGCLGYAVPKLLIQPIVENSVKYAFPLRNRVHIEIAARVRGEALELTVTDSGPGMSPQRLWQVRQSLSDEQGEHMGLRSIARRLRLQYGAESGLCVESSPRHGTAVTLRIEGGGGR